MIGYGLEEVYCYLNNTTSLDGAHSSTVDAIAQSYVVGHEYFQSFWDKPVGIVHVESFWEKKRVKRLAQEAELNRQLPLGCSDMGGKFLVANGAVV